MADNSLPKVVSGAVGSFKAAADSQTKNLTKIVKDLSNVFAKNKTDNIHLTQTVDEQQETIQGLVKKTDSTDKLLRESLGLQYQLIASLSKVNKDVDKIKDTLEKEAKAKEDKGEGGILGMLTKKFGKLSGAAVGAVIRNPMAYAALAGAGGVAAAGAGLAGAGAGGPSGPEGPNGGWKGAENNTGAAISPSTTFGNLSEEQKVSFLSQQAKNENVRPALNNPSGMMYGKFAESYGARPGSNNGTITLAQFPTLEAGQKAQRALWESQGFRDLRLEEAIRKWTTGRTDSNSTPQHYIDSLFRSVALRSQQQNNTPNTGGSPRESSSGPSGSNLTPRDTGSSGNNNQNENAGSGRQQGGQVIQDQMREAAVRRLPISSGLAQVLQRAASEAGVTVRVKSGGQPQEGQGGARTGSTRHDNGMAADLDLYSGETRLTPSTHLPIFKRFVAAASQAGATGIGAGEGYMGPDGSRLHVGFGTPAVWGAGGQGGNAANWLKETVGGQPGNGNTPNMGGRQQYGGQTGVGGELSLSDLNRRAYEVNAGQGGPQSPYMRPQMMNPMMNVGGMGMFGPGMGRGALVGGLLGGILPMIMNALGDGNPRSQGRQQATLYGSEDERRRVTSRTAIEDNAAAREVERPDQSREERKTPEEQRKIQANKAQESKSDNKLLANDSRHVLPDNDDWWGRLAKAFPSASGNIHYG